MARSDDGGYADAVSDDLDTEADGGEDDFDVSGEQAQRIALDVALGRPPKDYTPEMTAFRADIEAEWQDYKDEDPDAVLEIPFDLPE